MTGQKRTYKASKPKMFLFFLLLAIVFWILSKFSNEMTATVTAQLDYINTPSTVLVSEENEKEVSFDITGNGFQFLSYKLKKPIVDIDMSRYYEEQDSLVLISGNELSKLITTQLGNNTLVRNLSVDELGIVMDVFSSKRVPVKLISQLSYKEGYLPLGITAITPDSVTVSGASKKVERISFVETQVLVADNISEEVSKEITLKGLENTGINLSESLVVVSLSAEEFTQKQLSLAIEMMNVPDEVSLKLIPERLTVSFDVPMKAFNSVTDSDFRLVCDFTEKLTDENLLLPKLVRQPKNVHNVELSAQRIEFLIFN